MTQTTARAAAWQARACSYHRAHDGDVSCRFSAAAQASMGLDRGCACALGFCVGQTGLDGLK
eukprot:scaffold317525_cov22-Tisochrysis_lutea.AAC.1